jgi:hypothetical protein
MDKLIVLESLLVQQFRTDQLLATKLEFGAEILATKFLLTHLFRCVI